MSPLALVKLPDPENLTAASVNVMQGEPGFLVITMLKVRLQVYKLKQQVKAKQIAWLHE